MVNANKHRKLAKDYNRRVNKLRDKYYNELNKQGKRRAFLHSHLGLNSDRVSHDIDKKRAYLIKQYGGLL